MGYYDETFLNYYYYMASQFALSDRWFSPVSSKSIPNRIATFTGGSTQGVTQDPGQDDHLPQLQIKTIFQELDQGKGVVEDLLHLRQWPVRSGRMPALRSERHAGDDLLGSGLLL